MKSKLVESVSKPLCGMAITFASFVVWSLLFPISTLAQKTDDKYKIIHVKFKEQFSPKSSLTGSSARSGVGEMDKVSEKHKALSIRRIFPDAGKYEKAHRAFGLHLWYEIKLPVDASLNYALTDYRNLDYFNNVEECQEYTAV